MLSRWPGRGRTRPNEINLETILVHKAVVDSDELLSLEPEIAQQLLEQVTFPRGTETRTGRRVAHRQFDHRLRRKAVSHSPQPAKLLFTFTGVSFANYRLVLVFLLPEPLMLEYPSQE